MSRTRIGNGELSRATLARQLLLERATLPPLRALEHLVGLQAQVPGDPYVALWSRLAGFDPQELSSLVESRRAVRIVLMRGTIHLASAGDALLLRPLLQPVLDAELARHAEHGAVVRQIDLAAPLAHARALLEERPRTAAELRDALGRRFSPEHAAALAYACRNRLPLVQVPPRGLWRRRGGIVTTTLESWVGRSLGARPSLDEVVLRYFAAFGPASVGDLSAWSGLTGLRATVERLRPCLRAFHDERGRDLFDLPDAPRPDPVTPAPVRFLPEYDNVLLSHADRTRFVTDDERGRLGQVKGLRHGTVLVDGRAGARWRVEREGRRPLLVVRHLRAKAGSRAEIEAEGLRLLRLLGEEDVRGVRFEPLR